jgi:hypothetical protein
MQQLMESLMKINRLGEPNYAGVDILIELSKKLA